MFQGGGCRAIAYAGAFREATDCGIAFSEVAGTSAGAIFAALIAAGATPDFLEKIARSEELRNIPLAVVEKRKTSWLIVLITGILLRLKSACRWFKCIGKAKRQEQCGINELLDSKIAKNYKNTIRALQYRFGIHDSDNIRRILNGWLKELTSQDDVNFKQLKLPLYVFASDINNRKCRMWSRETTPFMSVAKAVASSCSIPIYFTPMEIESDNGEKSLCVDGGMLSNRPDFISKERPNYFQTISFKLDLKKSDTGNLFAYLNALVNTIIYGADHLQHETFGVEEETFGKHQVNEVAIDTGDISATDFSRLDPPTVDRLLNAGKYGMRRFVSDVDKLLLDGSMNYAVTPRRILTDREQMYNQVAFWSYDSYTSIIVADRNFDWVWPMFPTLVSWINQGTSVRVFYDKEYVGENDESQNAKKRLAESVGCRVEAVEPGKLIEGFFLATESYYKCVVFEEKKVGDEDMAFKGKVYNDQVDSRFIRLLIDRLVEERTTDGMALGKIVLEKTDVEEIFKGLKQVEQYADAKFELREVSLSELRFLKDTIRSLKYKELRHIQYLYSEADVNEYMPANLILNGKKSLMTPVIVEDIEGLGMVVIKGNARCMKSHKEKKEKILAVVVSGGKNIDGKIKLYGIGDLRLSEHKNRGSANLGEGLFRGVDQALRPNSNYLR
ncbi:MAG: patatin-like phospholipase family protein [Muribaculaceae bacterium]|nr:patatin-like phospholipase family protein [Muribaculaceae bacterium]